MAATCAACLKPITKGGAGRIAVSGTEVFHRACATLIDRSIGTRQRLEIIRLRAELDEANLVARRANARRDELDTEIRKVEASNRHRDYELLTLKSTLRTLEARTQSIEADRDSARREIALHQALAASKPAAPATNAEAISEKNDDGKDATEKRFSLLELD